MSLKRIFSKHFNQYPLEVLNKNDGFSYPFININLWIPYLWYKWCLKMVLLSGGTSRIDNYRKCLPPPGKNDSNQYQPTLRNPFVSRWRLQKLSTRLSAVIYYKAFSFCLFLRTLRNIFPLADFGIWSTNSTPPLSFLCGATREDKNSMIIFVCGHLATTDNKGFRHFARFRIGNSDHCSIIDVWVSS